MFIFKNVFFLGYVYVCIVCMKKSVLINEDFGGFGGIIIVIYELVYRY